MVSNITFDWPTTHLHLLDKTDLGVRSTLLKTAAPLLMPSCKRSQCPIPLSSRPCAWLPVRSPTTSARKGTGPSASRSVASAAMISDVVAQYSPMIHSAHDTTREERIWGQGGQRRGQTTNPCRAVVVPVAGMPCLTEAQDKRLTG